MAESGLGGALAGPVQCGPGQTVDPRTGRCRGVIAPQQTSYNVNDQGQVVQTNRPVPSVPGHYDASGTYQQAYDPNDRQMYGGDATTVGPNYVVNPQQPSNEQRQLVADLRSSLNLGGSPLASQSSSSSASGTGGPGGPLPERVGAGGVSGTGAGSNAALLRAKERAGQIARSSLTGLREALGERQILGSGVEAQATGDLAAQALGSISDVNREQLIQDDETARRMAELSYQGAITQRGQDITARGQDIGASLAEKNAQAAAYYDQQRQILDALKSLSY